MKLNKTIISLIVSGIFLIIAVSLAMSASSQNGEKNKLTGQLSTLRARLQSIPLEPLSAQQSNLEKQLEQTGPQLENTKSQLSQNVTSASISSVVFGAAKTFDLTVSELTSTDPAKEELNGVTMSGISVTANITGNSNDVVSFIKTLSCNLKTAVIKSVNMTIPETTGNDTTVKTAANATARIELIVYTYQGN